VFDDGEPAVRDEEDVAFRAPGALLALLPLLLVRWQDAFFWMTIVGGACLLALFTIVIPRSASRRIDELILPTIAAILSVPVVESLNWGTSSAITGLLFGLAWSNLRSPASGALLGAATTLKLYPGLGILGLIARKRARTALWAIGSFLLLNVLGSLVFGWSLLDVAALLVVTSQDYVGLFGNLSLAGLIAQAQGPAFLAVLIAGVALVVVLAFSQSHSPRQSVAFGMSLALVVSPLSWFHYEVTTLPIALWVYSRSSRWRWAKPVSWGWILASTILFWVAIALELPGLVNLVVLVRLLIPIALGLSPPELWEDQDSFGFEGTLRPLG
jgi:alpha-1,2-mannosyltransferase